MPDKGFVNFEDQIPMYVSGFGPKSLALAGKYGDGAVIGTPSSAASMENVWLKLEAGARDAGHKINREQYYTTSLAAMIVLDDGEAVESERVKYHCGAMVMASVHFSYDQWRNFGFQPPGHMVEIWDDYTALLESVPEERRHQRIHAGHNCWVVPEEEKFLTKALIERTCMVGTQEELVERLRELETAGLNQIMNLPSFDPRFEVLERIAKDIIPYV
jgi:5,10-methylenetetrahydromethanopterin reductase